MLKPLHDYVVLEKVKEEVKTESGILLTTGQAKDEPSLGLVTAVGPGKVENGTLVPIELEPGQKVIYKSKNIFFIKAVLVFDNYIFIFICTVFRNCRLIVLIFCIFCIKAD